MVWPPKTSNIQNSAQFLDQQTPHSNTLLYSSPALLKLIFRSLRPSRGLLLNYMCWNGNKLKKYLNIRMSNWYSNIRICRYWPMPMLIFESQSQSRVLLFNFLLGKDIKFKKCLKIRKSNWYSSTRISMYWPMYMPIFESSRQSRGLLFNFLFWKLYRFKKRKLDNSPRLRLGDLKIVMDIGQYIHILVLEYQFDILIFRNFFKIYSHSNTNNSITALGLASGTWKYNDVLEG